jgi:phosphoglycerate dehydrogenase-like enzyme
MRIAAVRRHAGECPPGLASVSDLGGLDELLASSDHLVVTLPLTPATRGLLDAERVRRVKSGAHVYNVGRGGIVDEAALLARLEDGSLGGAAMDVFAAEPLPPESPWWSAPRTIISPHLAGHHRDLAADVFEVFADNLVRFVAGRPLCHVADFGRGY